MFLNRTPMQCPAGETPNTEADWDAFSARALFASGTNMQQEKTIFLNQCKTDPENSVFAIETSLKDRETGSGGINPALLLAAAAAAFFIGG